ncbi:MAG: phosphatidate cytidylyltransferase [Spirochaetales bacterium]|nr:phosphatidate cytidylyltransferase [Spirochaetales bacterium]
MNDRVKTTRHELTIEFYRKSIHLLIGLVPLAASYRFELTVAFLISGTLLYTLAEMMRLSGREVYIISGVTRAASRSRDRDRFVLGPVTLGLGALLALMLYPERAAFIGIYALAFGDGISSIAGKLLGKVEIPFTGGKTLVGSGACFLIVYLAAYILYGDLLISLGIAAVATFLEALPSTDFDNILIPVGTGFAAEYLFVRFL